MSLEDEVKRIIREKVWADPTVLESVGTGEPAAPSDADTLRILRTQIEGLAEALVEIAREVDWLKGS
jgi:hypothetical protein